METAKKSKLVALHITRDVKRKIQILADTQFQGNKSEAMRILLDEGFKAMDNK